MVVSSSFLIYMLLWLRLIIIFRCLWAWVSFYCLTYLTNILNWTCFLWMLRFLILSFNDQSSYIEQNFFVSTRIQAHRNFFLQQFLRSHTAEMFLDCYTSNNLICLRIFSLLIIKTSAADTWLIHELEKEK